MKRLLASLVACVLCACCGMPAAAIAEGTSTASSATASSTAVAAQLSTVDYSTNATVDVSSDAAGALMNGSGFGISGYTRSNKGTNKLYSGTYYGYRYPMAAQDAFSVIAGNGFAIVYIPQSIADDLGVDIDDPAFERTFLATLAVLDDAASNGGPRFSTLDEQFYFTSSTTVTLNGYEYGFSREVEEGYYYATSTLPGSEDGSAGALYEMTGMLTPAAATTLSAKATGLAALGEFFGNLDWRPLWVSLKTAGVGLIVVFVLGLLAAWGTIKVSDRWKGVLDTVFTIPMVLPPTVCGFLLLLFFGNSTAVGRWFIAHGINLVFTWPAAVIACIVVSFPLMYRSARGAFEQLDSTMLDAARTLGWSEGKVFVKLMLPLAWPSIAAGTVLAFARAIGEFGATLFFAGNYAGVTQTIPIAIYFDWMAGQTDVALFWVIVVILISFLVILFINIYSSHTQRYRLGESVESDG